MAKKFSVLFVVLALIVIAIPVNISAQDDDPCAEKPYAGTSVTVFGAYTDESEVNAFNDGFVDFEACTGIDVIYEGASDFEILVNTRVEGGDAPDIAGFPQPGLMMRFANNAVDISSFLPMDYLEQQYDPSWIAMGTTRDGKVVGVWGRIIVKSLVWYSPRMFEDAGYDVPETWEELLALSDQIVEDGGVPWYTAMESGAATGWVGTDWIEDLVLRTTSLENYDNWTVPASPAERFPFSSPEVKRAWELMGDILLNPDYMYGGTDAILDDSFFDTGVPIVEGEAFMAKMGSFMPGWLFSDYPDLEIGPDGDLNYFYFPPIDEAYGRPVLTSGDIYTMFNDRPEVRLVIEHLTKAESLRPGIQAGIFISPHKDVDQSWYREPEAGIAEILANADAFRFDGGDLQPAVVGAGAFWQGVVDYISGTKSLDQILADIDAAWPTE